MRAATLASGRRRAPGEPSVARLGAMLLVRPPPQSAEGTWPLHAFRPRSTPATRRARASRHAGPPAENHRRHRLLMGTKIGRTTPGTSWWFRPTAARRPDRYRCRGLHSASTPRCRAPCPRSAPSDQSAFRAGRFSARSSCRTSPIRDSDACSASRRAMAAGFRAATTAEADAALRLRELLGGGGVLGAARRVPTYRCSKTVKADRRAAEYSVRHVGFRRPRRHRRRMTAPGNPGGIW